MSSHLYKRDVHTDAAAGLFFVDTRRGRSFQPCNIQLADGSGAVKI